MKALQHWPMGQEKEQTIPYQAFLVPRTPDTAPHTTNPAALIPVLPHPSQGPPCVSCKWPQPGLRGGRKLSQKHKQSELFSGWSLSPRQSNSDGSQILRPTKVQKQPEVLKTCPHRLKIPRFPLSTGLAALPLQRGPVQECPFITLHLSCPQAY